MCCSSWILLDLVTDRIGASTAMLPGWKTPSSGPCGSMRIFDSASGKVRIRCLHARMDLLFIERRDPKSFVIQNAYVRFHPITPVRDLEPPKIVCATLKTGRTPNFINRFTSLFHCLCNLELRPRKSLGGHPTQNRQLFSRRQPIEAGVDDARTEMKCRIAVVSGLEVFSRPRAVLH